MNRYEVHRIHSFHHEAQAQAKHRQREVIRFSQVQKLQRRGTLSFTQQPLSVKLYKWLKAGKRVFSIRLPASAFKALLFGRSQS